MSDAVEERLCVAVAEGQPEGVRADADDVAVAVGDDVDDAVALPAEGVGETDAVDEPLCESESVFVAVAEAQLVAEPEKEPLTEDDAQSV